MSKDNDTLANALHELLTGNLKLGLNLVGIGKALKASTEARDRAWIVQGLKKYLDENEEAIPVLAAALGASGVDKIKAWMAKRQ